MLYINTFILEFFIQPDEVEKFNENENEEKVSELKKVKRILQKKINQNVSPSISNDFSLFQPHKFSYGRNSYPHIFKELKSKVDIEKLN